MFDSIRGDNYKCESQKPFGGLMVLFSTSSNAFVFKKHFENRLENRRVSVLF